MLQKQRQNIILTADDFGKSEKANRNILRLAKVGKLDRVSVMIEGDISEGEAKKILETGVKLDIHLELIWQKRRRNLLKDHTLRQVAVFFVNYLWGDWPVPQNPRSGAAAVRKEWKRQIEKFRKIFGRVPDGISSHEHTHLFSPYFKIALELAKIFGISFVRFGKRSLPGEKNSVKSILGIMRFLNKGRFLNSKAGSTEYFASLDWFERVEDLKRATSGKNIEISCHPEREEEFDLIINNF